MANTITPSFLDQLRADILDALQSVEKHHGVKFLWGRGKYSPRNATLSLEVALVQDGEVQSKTRMDWKRYATQYGFREDDLDKVVTVHGKQVKITGWALSRRKYPVEVLDIDSQSTMFYTAASIEAALERQRQR